MEETKTNINDWKPRTTLGKKVKLGEITDMDYILDKGMTILESEIVDVLVPDLSTDLLMIGQSKGKFGGGQRRVFRQTQKKTCEGNQPSFATYAVVGNKDGLVGVGYGKSKETVPAREKAIRAAKLGVFKIRRGCGSWECACKDAHSIPFEVRGKCGSVIVVLKPAPKGTGLVSEKEVAKVLATAGIKDVWSQVYGSADSKINLVKATEDALKNLVRTKIKQSHVAILNVTEGKGKTMPKVAEVEKDE